jgi:CheY-like chemotaxis protein
VFDRFRQGESGTMRSHGGLGLGLSIAKQLVERHGGYIAARSDGVGHGATFTVHLPRADRTAAGSYGPGPPAPAIGPEPTAELRGRHVLVVDDELDARVLLQAVLEEGGAVVTTAASVAEALAEFEREAPEILVSDIGMPGENGYDLIRHVRAMAPARGGNVPALALTAYARNEDRMRALSAGYGSHLAKPVEPTTLRRAVASLAPAH